MTVMTNVAIQQNETHQLLQGLRLSNDIKIKDLLFLKGCVDFS